MRKSAVFIIMCVTVGIIFGLGSVASADGSTIYVDPPTVSGVTGNTVTVNVKVGDVADLYGYQFSLRFNPNLVRVRDVAEGAFLKQAGSTWFSGGQINNTSGTIKDIYSVLLSASQGASGSGTLASIVFDITSGGSCAVDLENALLSDSNARPISAQGTVSHTVAPTYLTSSGGYSSGGGGSSNQPTLDTPAQTGEAVGGPQLGEIRGRVVNQASRVIPSATARINGVIVQTDSNGVFAFTLVHPGTYEVHYDAPGYVTQTQELQVVRAVITGAPTVILKSAAKGSSAKIGKKSTLRGKKGRIKRRSIWWRWRR